LGSAVHLGGETFGGDEVGDVVRCQVRIPNVGELSDAHLQLAGILFVGLGKPVPVDRLAVFEPDGCGSLVVADVTPGGPTWAARAFRPTVDAAEDLDELAIGTVLDQFQVARDLLRATGALAPPRAVGAAGLRPLPADQEFQTVRTRRPADS
jgi:hypothetical protein